MKYVIIDTETTGLDKYKHELIAFGALIMIDGIITETIELKIKPTNMDVADPKALEVNGFTERRWRNATNPDYAVSLIKAFFIRHMDGTLVGHNVQFDIGFIQVFAEKYKIEIPFSYPYMDTRDICRTTLPYFGAKSMSLDNICRFLGWERRRAHSALSDCEDCAKIIRNLCPPDPKFLLRLYLMKSIRQVKGLSWKL